MTWISRIDVAEALEAAGWVGDEPDPLGLLRHPSGAVWAVSNDSGDCGLDCPGGAVVEFPGDAPDQVVIAACLAAADQLEAAPTVVCDTEGHAIPCACSQESARPELPVRVPRAQTATYTVPSLSRTEVNAQARSNPRPADCRQCQAGTPVDHWPSGLTCRSSFAQDGFGTDRLVRVHCTCDRCF
ncbi:hypothetical protein ABZX75_17300 [Streptomyces sp. NPDC003038]|uniref:hypothetical protein n=1 Tax=unclassified Streptomyces TaxID=2593676 RepID=UPI0033BC7767